MMKKYLYFVVAAAGLAASVIAAKPEPELIKPSAPWNAHYADDSCLLGRAFGTGDDKITLLISRFAPGDGFILELSGKKIKAGTADSKATLQFGPSEKEQKIDFVYGTRGKDLPAVFFRSGLRIGEYTDEELELIKNTDKDDATITLPPISAEREANIRSLSISGITRRPIILATGPMGKTFAEMRKCTDNLLTSWGVDATKHHKLQRRLVPIKRQNWIVSDDYPKAMLNAGKRSIVQIRLIVDVSGTPTSCNIQQSNQLLEFDTIVCKSFMKRAKFKPALDENGVPIVSYWAQSVFFTVPT